jgi:hypothetical protein
MQRYLLIPTSDGAVSGGGMSRIAIRVLEQPARTALSLSELDVVLGRAREGVVSGRTQTSCSDELERVSCPDGLGRVELGRAREDVVSGRTQTSSSDGLERVSCPDGLRQKEWIGCPAGAGQVSRSELGSDRGQPPILWWRTVAFRDDGAQGLTRAVFRLRGDRAHGLMVSARDHQISLSGSWALLTLKFKMRSKVHTPF